VLQKAPNHARSEQSGSQQRKSCHEYASGLIVIGRPYNPRTLTDLTSAETGGINWLPDSRRLLYFTDIGTWLMLLDTASKRRTAMSVHLPGPSTDDVFGRSRDGRTINYGAQHAEADIWMAERK